MSPLSTRTIAATLCAVGAVVGVSFSPTLVNQAKACFGYIPPPPPVPECFKGYTFAFNIPQVILANPGGSVDIPIDSFHFVSLAEAVPMSPVCPPGPYTVRMTADVECDNGVLILGIPLPAFDAGSNANIALGDLITIPGDPGCCTITITSTVEIGPCFLTQVQKQEFCIVEPSPSDPTAPRLDLTLLTPSTSQNHPGDQALACYELKNNDLNNSVLVTFDANMRNVAGAPSGGDLTNTIIVSDPVGGPDGDIGDNFPIAFLDELPPPFCIDLPPDPGGFPIPTITRTYTLAPGEAIEVKIAARPWPMCADGSCGHSLVRAFGTFDDGTVVKACASAVVAVDNSAPPQFAWPGSGVVGWTGPDPLGGTTGVGIFGQPFPEIPTEIVDMCLIPLPLPPDPFSVEGQPIPSQTQFCNVLAGQADLGPFTERMTLKAQFPPESFTVDSFFDIAYRIEFRGGIEGANEDPIIDDYAVAPGAPQGLEQIAPGGMGFLTLPSQKVPEVEAQVTHQVVANAQLLSGDSVPVELFAINFSVVAPNVVEVSMQGIVPLGPPSSSRGFPEFVTGMNIVNDFRGFFGIKEVVSNCESDFNGDGMVDIIDFGRFGSAFGSATGDANYDAAADINGDGLVDIIDFGIFGTEFGRTDC